MPLVPAICTQCGGQLKVDDAAEAAVCPYCNTPFVVEKAINNYQNTYVTNIGNLHAENVYFSGEHSLEERLRSGVTFLKMMNYKAAEETFQKITQEFPYEYRGWFGLIRVITKEFREPNLQRTQMQQIEELLEKIDLVATEEQKTQVRRKVKTYCDPILQEWKRWDERKKNKEKQLKDQYQYERQQLKQQREELEEKSAELKSPVDIAKTILMIIAIGMLLMAMVEEGIYGFVMMAVGMTAFSAVVLGIVKITIQIPFTDKKNKIEWQIGEIDRRLEEQKAEYKKEIKNLE